MPELFLHQGRVQGGGSYEASTCMQAEELGPRFGDHKGPGLVLVRGVQCSGTEFLAWFFRTPWVRRVVNRLYFLHPETALHPAKQADSPAAIAAAILATGIPRTALRIQCAPRTSEMDVAVRRHASTACCFVCSSALLARLMLPANRHTARCAGRTGNRGVRDGPSRWRVYAHAQHRSSGGGTPPVGLRACRAHLPRQQDRRQSQFQL